MTFHSEVGANVAHIVATVQALAARRVDAVLFPECAVTGYHRNFSTLPRAEVEAGLETIRLAARNARCHVLVGSPTFAGRKRYNSLVGFDRKGRENFCYSKIQLTPRDARFFTPGNQLACFQLDDIPCAAIICHERR